MKKFWIIFYWSLFICWIIGALLSIMHVNGGFITNYLADITFPGWFYIFIRGLNRNDKKLPKLIMAGSFFGEIPERAIISIFLVGLISEYITKFWPNGFIRGRFDVFDILCYALSLMIPYVIDKTVNKKQ